MSTLQQQDIELLHHLVEAALKDLPASLRPMPDEARMSASEYGHWSRRQPQHTVVNIGVQRHF